MIVEIFSDVVCPWCAVGKARFEVALEGFAHQSEVQVIYRSYELDPNAPAQRSGTIAEHMARKYAMTLADAQKANDHLTEVAALDGLEFHFDRCRRGNTFDAHRLLQFALEEGNQAALVDAFMQGYFRDGRAIGEPAELVALAESVGFAAPEIAAILDSDAFGTQVRGDEHRAQTLGITGVPFFLIDGRFAIPGAQPVERFALGLQRAWDKIVAAES